MHAVGPRQSQWSRASHCSQAFVEKVQVVNVYVYQYLMMHYSYMYLQAPMYVVTNECATVVSLPLYVEASQCTVQSLNKYSVLRLKALTQPLVKLINLLFLKKQSAILKYVYLHVTLFVLLTRVSPSSLFLSVSRNRLASCGFVSASST